MSEEIKRYAVAATCTKQLPDKISIKTVINSYEATSKEEAIGKFILEVSKLFPDHDIHTRPVFVEL